MSRKRQPRATVVLHVEDDLPTQHLRSEILRRAGCEVTSATTVAEAVGAVRRTRPDVILCDVKLPDGTGFQICREMRTLLPGVPVILISAVYRDEFARQAAAFGGASEYLTEPVTPEELVRSVKRHLA